MPAHAAHYATLMCPTVYWPAGTPALPGTAPLCSRKIQGSPLNWKAIEDTANEPAIMTTEILNGQPPQPADEALLKAYHDAVIKQADLYVDLAKELLKLELAIPGIYPARRRNPHPAVDRGKRQSAGAVAALGVPVSSAARLSRPTARLYPEPSADGGRIAAGDRSIVGGYGLGCGVRLNRYRLSSVVADWLAEQQDEPALEIRQRAARYQLWMFEHLQATLEQALVAHESLRRAGLDEEAARLALAVIVPHFDRRGLYHTLLKEWLPVLRESQDQTIKGAAFNRSGKISLHVGDYENAMTYLQQSLAICRAIGDRAGEETTLNNIGLVYLAQGDYATALDYLQQSLAIRRAIGDRAGLCRGLFNMGHIHRTNEEPQQALVSWVTAYRIAREIGLAEALQNLDNLAKQLGGAGLEY